MWKSNLIIALRVLGRNKTISLINIAGLSVAFAVAVLCLLFVRHETSFDTWHEKGDRVFAIYLEQARGRTRCLFPPFHDDGLQTARDLGH